MSKDPVPPLDKSSSSDGIDPMEQDYPATPPDIVEADAGVAPPAPPKDSAAKFTRAGATWAFLAISLLILIVLLVFIVQNGEYASMHFLVWEWSLPLGVQFLLAAIGGALLTVLVGTWRIFQLRRAAKKNLKALTDR